MKKFTKTIILLSLLSSCQSYTPYNKADFDKNKEEQISVAKYKNGTATLADANIELDKIIAQNSNLVGVKFNNLPKSQKELIAKEAIIHKIFVKEAIKRNLDDDEVKKVVKLFRETLLKEKLIEELVKEVNEEEYIKNKYDTLVAELKDKKDVRIRYIALKEEKEANKLYKKLRKSPKNFSYYAKKRSIDKATAKKGGDLGFVLRDQLPVAIANRTKEMKKYEISKPIQSGGNWIIVKFVAERPAQISKYEDIRDSLAAQIAKQEIQKFTKESFEKAEIKFLVE